MLSQARTQIASVARNIQEAVCNIILDIVKEDAYAIAQGYDTDILKELRLMIAELIPVEEIKPLYMQCITLFDILATPKERMKMFELKYIPALARVMKSKDGRIVKSGASIILHIVQEGRNTVGIDSLHPFREQMEKDGVVKILFELGITGDYTEDETARSSATIIAHLYGALPLPKFCKAEVISILKRIVSTSEPKLAIHPFSALMSLALCIENHDDLLQGKYLEKLIQILNTNQQEFIQNALMIIIRFIEIGTEDTQKITLKGIPIPKIKFLSEHTNIDVKRNALYLLSWLENEQEMKNLLALKSKAESSSDEEMMDLACNSAIKDICVIIKRYVERKDKFYGELILAFKLAKVFMFENRSLAIIALMKNSLLENLMMLINFLDLDEIEIIHAQVLNCIVNSCVQSQRTSLFDRGVCKILSRLLDCKTEKIVDYATDSYQKIVESASKKERISPDSSLEVPSKDPHPFRQKLEDDGTLLKLVNIFLHPHYKNKMVNTQAAITIIHLFRSAQIPANIRNAAFDHLKQNPYKDDPLIHIKLLQTLAQLAKNIGF